MIQNRGRTATWVHRFVRPRCVAFLQTRSFPWINCCVRVTDGSFYSFGSIGSSFESRFDASYGDHDGVYFIAFRTFELNAVVHACVESNINRRKTVASRTLANRKSFELRKSRHQFMTSRRTAAVTGPPPKPYDFKTRVIGGSRSPLCYVAIQQNSIIKTNDNVCTNRVSFRS